MVCGAQVYGTDALARVILCRYLPHIAAMEFSGKYNVKGVRNSHAFSLCTVGPLTIVAGGHYLLFSDFSLELAPLLLSFGCEVGVLIIGCWMCIRSVSRHCYSNYYSATMISGPAVRLRCSAVAALLRRCMHAERGCALQKLTNFDMSELRVKLGPWVLGYCPYEQKFVDMRANNSLS